VAFRRAEPIAFPPLCGEIFARRALRAGAGLVVREVKRGRPVAPPARHEALTAL